MGKTLFRAFYKGCLAVLASWVPAPLVIRAFPIVLEQMSVWEFLGLEGLTAFLSMFVYSLLEELLGEWQ